MGRFKCKSLRGGGVSSVLTAVLAAVSLTLFAPHPAVGDTWSKILDVDGEHDGGADVLPLASGESIVVGSAMIDSVYEAWAVRLDEDGDVVWEFTYPVWVASAFTAVAMVASDKAVAVGWAADSQDRDLYAVCFDTDDGNLEWHSTYGGADTDEANDVALVDKTSPADDELVIVGSTDSFDGVGPEYNYDFWVLVVDPTDGSIKTRDIRNETYELQVKIGGLYNDVAHAVVVADADNDEIVIVGYTASYGEGLSDVWVLRTSNLLEEPDFQTTYGGTGADAGYDATALTGSSDIVIVGAENSTSDSTNIWVISISDTGGINWEQSYSSDSNPGVTEVATAVTEVDSDHLLVAGYGVADPDANWYRDSYDMLLFDIDPDDGSLGWQRFYDSYPGDEYDDQACGVALASDDDILLTGWSIGNDVSDYFDVWVLKLDEYGHVEPSGSPDGICRFREPGLEVTETEETDTDTMGALKVTDAVQDEHTGNEEATTLTEDVLCEYSP